MNITTRENTSAGGLTSKVRAIALGVTLVTSTLIAGSIAAPAAFATSPSASPSPSAPLAHKTALARSVASWSVTKGKSDKLSVHLTDATSHTNLANTKVWLQEARLTTKKAKIDGKVVSAWPPITWKSIKVVTTGKNGKALLTVKPAGITYRWYRPAFSAAGVLHEAAASATFTIGVIRAGLVRPSKSGEAALLEMEKEYAKKQGVPRSNVSCVDALWSEGRENGIAVGCMSPKEANFWGGPPLSTAAPAPAHKTALTESHSLKTVKKGGKDKLSVRLTDKTAKKGVSNTKVWLQERLPKTTKVKGKTVSTTAWTNVKSVTTDKNGKASLVIKPTTTHSYRWDRPAFTKAGVSYKATATASFTIAVKSGSAGRGNGIPSNQQLLAQLEHSIAQQHGWSDSQVHCSLNYSNQTIVCSTPSGNIIFGG